MPEIIIYKGNQIHKFNESCYVAYVMDRYGDIEEYETVSLEKAKAFVDHHKKGFVD